MFKVRNLVVVCLVLVALAVPAVGTATAQSSNEKPKATEVGVTDTEIHIGVVADVDNPFAPGLFKGAVDGVKAGAAFLNSKAGGGGLAGRKVVVDFYDSKLNGNESRNATIQGCENDYALVGTSALFLTEVTDIVGCKDQAGAATGIPDMSAVTTGVPESCSAMSFPAYGTALDCPTVNQNPQTFYANQGPAKWELSKNKGGLHGVTIVGNDTKDAARGGTILGLAAQKSGIKADQGDPVVAVSGRDPQSVFTPIVQKMKTDNSNWSLNVGAANQALLIRSEAEIQGIDTSKVLWECASCYGNTLITDNAKTFEGEVQFLGFLPFEEKSVNKTVDQLREVHEAGGRHARPVLGVLLRRHAGVRRCGQRDREVRRRQRPHPHEPHHRHQGPHRLRRRRHARQAVVQGRQDHVLLHDGAVQERQVGPPVPHQEGHVRLQGVERHRDQGEPDPAVVRPCLRVNVSAGACAPADTRSYASTAARQRGPERARVTPDAARGERRRTGGIHVQGPQPGRGVPGTRRAGSASRRHRHCPVEQREGEGHRGRRHRHRDPHRRRRRRRQPVRTRACSRARSTA